LETSAITANAQPNPAKNIANPRVDQCELPVDEGKIAFSMNWIGN
jgi:hypothetical protein